MVSPTGRRLTQKMAKDLSGEQHVIVICGHYEGVDHRVIEHLIDAEISIGDYVLTNGAIAGVVLVDAVVRLLPGVLGDEQSAADDSFSPIFMRNATAYGVSPRLRLDVVLKKIDGSLLEFQHPYHRIRNNFDDESGELRRSFPVGRIGL